MGHEMCRLQKFRYFCSMLKKLFIATLLFGLACIAQAQDVKLAVLKYGGGGDWYANPTALPNLVRYCNNNLMTSISEDIATVDVGSIELFNYPLVHMTGHGNVIFSPEEAENLRNYLLAGGFLHISDNYGLDVYIRREMRKVFPGLEFIELPFDHPIYHQRYDFPEGLPKIHEHDDRDPQGFGLLYEGRLICFYDFECDLGDGWESPEVHNDPPEKHRDALRMGANIVQYVFDR